MAAQKRVEIPVSPEYVNWGVWECLREILQNAIDSQVRGHALTCDWKGGKLLIGNEGAILGRDKLILGGTDKRGDSSQRGQFGEGMKLAWMRLIRLGYTLTLTVGAERWVPSIVKSEQFGGAEVLRVDFRTVKDRGGVFYEINGVSEDDWLTAKSRFMALSPPADDEVIRTSSGDLLLGESFRGLLFCKGIFVTKMQGNLRYGYDLPNVTLDRDRRIPTSWSLQYYIGQVYANAVGSGLLKPAMVASLIEGRYDEGEHVTGAVLDGYANDLAEGLAEDFRQKHGPNSVPAMNLSEADQLRASGMVPVIVSDSHARVLQKTLGSAEEIIQKKASAQARVLQLNEIDAGQLAFMMRVMNLIRDVEPTFTGNVNVVEFGDRKVCGRHSSTSNEVQVASWVLADPVVLVETLIHEVAHVYGGDGAVAHEQAIEKISAKIIIRLMK